jgi:hypothetical protein
MGLILPDEEDQDRDRAPTRRELLSAAAAGAVAAPLLAAAGAEAASASRARVPPRLEDADRLHRLLSVELLMLYCYEHVIGGPLLKPHARRLLDPLRAHEEAHIKVLRSHLVALGGVPPGPPVTVEEANRDLARRSVGGRLGQLKGARDALYLLLAMEQVVLGAYFVAVGKLEDRRLLRLAASIMGSEAQHEALVGAALYPGRADAAVPYALIQGTV